MILVSRVLNLLALGFTVVFSGFLLLCVNWRALHAECIVADTCDISEVRAGLGMTSDFWALSLGLVPGRAGCEHCCTVP